MFNAGVAETLETYFTSYVNTTGNIIVSSINSPQTFSATAIQITVVNISRTAVRVYLC
jgi:hypothetical protein